MSLQILNQKNWIAVLFKTEVIEFWKTISLKKFDFWEINYDFWIFVSFCYLRGTQLRDKKLIDWLITM